MECRLKAKKCGGCPMLGLDYAEQLKQKEAAVRKLVGKYGPVAPIRGAENPCHYRNKVISTFAAGPGGKLVSGIYAAGTHKVLPVESCLLQDEVLDTVMQAVLASKIEEVCDGIENRLRAQGLTLRQRYSPGYFDLDITEQRKIFALLDLTKRIGLTLSDTCQMIPTKSVTAIIGIEPQDGGQAHE